MLKERTLLQQDNWDLKNGGPDFDGIMVKCNNPVRLPDNTYEINLKIEAPQSSDNLL